MPQERYLLPQEVLAIKTEIQTGRTFARIALGSDDPDKTARNTANARKAYDVAREWAGKALLNPAEQREIADQLELLKAELAKLEQHSK